MIEYILQKWDFFFPKESDLTFVKTVIIGSYIKGCQYLNDCEFDGYSAVSQLSSAYGIYGWGMDLSG